MNKLSYIILISFLIICFDHQAQARSYNHMIIQKSIEFKPSEESVRLTNPCKGPFGSVDAVFKKAEDSNITHNPEKLKQLQILFMKQYLTKIFDKLYVTKDKVELERIMMLTMMDLVGCVDSSQK